MQSVMGLVMLIGIVVNNAIVLVDYINLLRRERKMELKEAIMEAGRLRLRPILMTALTTILGLVPLAIGLGTGAEIQASMARVVIGGLLASTIITLVLIPLVYVSATLLSDRVKARVRKWWTNMRGGIVCFITCATYRFLTHHLLVKQKSRLYGPAFLFITIFWPTGYAIRLMSRDWISPAWPIKDSASSSSGSLPFSELRCTLAKACILLQRPSRSPKAGAKGIHLFKSPSVSSLSSGT